MSSSNTNNLVDLVAAAGKPPEGVDLATHAIANIPPKVLNPAVRNSSFSYAGLEQLKQKRPEVFARVIDNPHPENALAQEIGLKQQELSRPKRYLASIATMAALGIGGFAFGSSVDPVEIPHKTAHGTVVERGDDSTKIGLGIGGAAAVLGGFVSSFAGLGLSGRLAHRPAQRVVRKAKAN